MTRTCEQCGGAFTVSPSVVRKGHGRYCSATCRRAWMRETQRGPRCHFFRGGPVSLPCLQCDVVFEVRRSNTARKFCSMNCRDRYRRGHRHHSWRHGRTVLDLRGYCRDVARVRSSRKRAAGGSLTLTQWEEIKARYGYRCPRCFRSEPEIALTIDHVRPVSAGGSSNPTNIQPLCRSCNSKKNRRFISYEPDGFNVEVTDFAALVRAVARGAIPAEILIPNQYQIDQLARSMKGNLKVPGIEAVCTKDVAAARR